MSKEFAQQILNACRGKDDGQARAITVGLCLAAGASGTDAAARAASVPDERSGILRKKKGVKQSEGDRA